MCPCILEHHARNTQYYALANSKFPEENFPTENSLSTVRAVFISSRCLRFITWSTIVLIIALDTEPCFITTIYTQIVSINSKTATLDRVFIYRNPLSWPLSILTWDILSQFPPKSTLNLKTWKIGTITLVCTQQKIWNFKRVLVQFANYSKFGEKMWHKWSIFTEHINWFQRTIRQIEQSKQSRLKVL